MAGRTLVAAVTILALSAGGAAAQTVDDLAAIFPAAGWTAQATDSPTVSCVAAFDDGGGARGYDIRLNNGTRYGELRFAWQGTDQVVSYDLAFNDGGTRASRVSVAWGFGSRDFTGSLSLAEAVERAENPLVAAVLQLVWSGDFCEPAIALAALFPANGWTRVAIAAPLDEVFTCIVVFGPTEDDREGHHFATADGAFGGTMTFFGDENDRWTLSYRRETDAQGGLIAASVRTGGGGFQTIDLRDLGLRLPAGPAGAPEEVRARFATRVALVRELAAYLETTIFCP